MTEKIYTQENFENWTDPNFSWETEGDAWESVSNITYVKETRTTLYSSGEYIVLANSQPYINVQLVTAVKENIIDSGIGSILKKEFRYSLDSLTFSEFQIISSENFALIGPVKFIWFQFRYILLSGGPVTISQATPVFNIIASDKFANYKAPSIQDQNSIYAFPIIYKSNFLWEPYKLNKAIRLYKDLNLMVNSLFGHQASYYRVLPQGRSKDVFLMEYSLFSHDLPQCLKIVVPNNEFPDNKLNMGPFGVDFEIPFEVHIDREYYQKIFGDGSGPQKRDVIFFPNTNRAYEIQSSYLFRDFMNEPLYFKISLVKWLPKTNVEQTEEVDSLESFSASAGRLFSDLIEDDELKTTNPQQYNVAYSTSDPVRSYIDQNQIINNEDLLNYYTKVSENSYRLQSTLNSNMIKVNLDSSKFINDVSYYARLSPTSTQSDIQYYYSMGIFTYKGIDENGLCIFSYKPGISQIQSLFNISQIIGPESQFYLYTKEYDGTIWVDLVSSCNTSSALHYKNKPIKYSAINKFLINEDRAFSAWFRLKTNTNPTHKITSIVLDSVKNILTVSVSSPQDILVGDLISIYRTSDNSFSIFGIVDTIVSQKQYTVKVDQYILDYVNINFTNWLAFIDLRSQRSFSNVFINSMSNNKGFKIELFESRHFQITINDKALFFSIPHTMLKIQQDIWHGLFINISNTFKQLSLNLWKMQWDSITNVPATTELKLLYSNTLAFSKQDASSNIQFFLEPSFMDLTNIRLFNKVAETEKQTSILNQSILRDAQWGIIIDNALPQSHAPYIGYTK